jgi:hypothetical protein
MKTVIIALFLIFYISNSFADEIRLKDGTVIKCKIIQVTPKYIEYDPEGARTFDMLPRDQVVVIIYNDGTVIKIN